MMDVAPRLRKYGTAASARSTNRRVRRDMASSYHRTPPFPPVEAEAGEQAGQADANQQDGPGRLVEPFVVRRDEPQRDAGIDQTGVVEALALALVAEERHRDGEAEVRPVERPRVLAGLAEVGQGFEDREGRYGEQQPGGRLHQAGSAAVGERPDGIEQD